MSPAKRAASRVKVAPTGSIATMSPA